MLDLALKQNVPDPAFWLDLGRIALEVWPLADSENRAAHMAKVNPFFEKAIQRAEAAKDEAAVLRAADFYLFSNQIDKATAICESAVKRTGSLDSRKRLVRLYEALERTGDSFKALEELVQAYPRDVEHRRLLAEVLKDLGRAGLVASHRGALGGYQLARSADRITLGDVVGALEGRPALFDCRSSGPERASACDVDPVCPIRSPLHKIREALWRLFERTTLRSLLEPGRLSEIDLALASRPGAQPTPYLAS